MMISTEITDNLVLSTCLSVASLVLEIDHTLSMSFRIESTYCFRLTMIFALSKLTRTDGKYTGYFFRLSFTTNKHMRPLEWHI